jgi:DNA ligase (NAD+)
MNVDSKMERIKELETILKNADEAYYNLDPIMSDREYDELKEELKKISPENDEIKKIGSTVSSLSTWNKEKHVIEMGSLEKVNTEEEFREWARMTKSLSFVIAHKMDGSSLELVYSGGRLEKAITRGDGMEGDNVWVNARQIPNIPEFIPNTSGRTFIRGEVILEIDKFNEFFSEEYSNPRNTANGKIREKKGGGRECEKLKFFAFQVIAENFSVITEEEQCGVLNSFGFNTPHTRVGDIDYMIAEHNSIGESRKGLNHEIDGTVIKVNSLKKQSELGSKNMRPIGQIAWKFKPETAEAKAKNVVWQVGLTGRVSPVLEIEPTKIGGVVVSRISLHNMAMFNKLKLYKGCRVEVVRRGDVIPYVERVIELKIY